MNYLAHAFFSYGDGQLLVGNILADLLHGKEIKLLDAEYDKGIRLHRLIDSLTDNDPLHRKSLYILYPSQGKYSPVVMDIYYDFFLSKHWAAFSEISLFEFCRWAYDELAENLDFLPESKRDLLRRMIADDFLHSCADLERLQATFVRLKRRVSFPSNLDLAVQDLKANEVGLEKHFLTFFPQIASKIKSEMLA